MNENNQLMLDHDSQQHLIEASKWAKFLSILGFIGLGFTVIIGVFVGVMMGNIIEAVPSDNPLRFVNSGLISAFYIVAAIVLYFPIMALYRFADRIKLGILSQEQSKVTEAFINLKKFYKYYGILVIIFIAFYFIAFVVTLSMGKLF